MRSLYLLSAILALASADLVNVQFPHLLVPLKRDTPNTTYGTVKTGEVSNHVYTEVSFDVPGDNNAAICYINFHINVLPAKNAPRELSGNAPYEFNVLKLKNPGINKDKDTWNKHPEQGDWVATIQITEEGDVNVQGGWLECPKWNVAQFLLRPVSDRPLRYFWFELDYSDDDGGPHGITLEMHN